MEQHSDTVGTAAPAGIVILVSAQQAGGGDRTQSNLLLDRLASRKVSHKQLSVGADGRLGDEGAGSLAAVTRGCSGAACRRS